MERHLFVRVDTPARPVPTCSFFFFSAPKKRMFVHGATRPERERSGRSEEGAWEEGSDCINVD
jgi:hypothetical protein